MALIIGAYTHNILEFAAHYLLYWSAGFSMCVYLQLLLINVNHNMIGMRYSATASKHKQMLDKRKLFTDKTIKLYSTK